MENLNYWKGLQAPLQEEGASEHTKSGLSTPAFFNRLAAREVKGRVKIFVRDQCRLQANPILEIVFERACNLWFVDGFERIGKADTLTSKGSAMTRFLIVLTMLLLGASVQTAMADCMIEPFSSSGKTKVEGLTDGSTCMLIHP